MEERRHLTRQPILKQQMAKKLSRLVIVIRTTL